MPARVPDPSDSEPQWTSAATLNLDALSERPAADSRAPAPDADLGTTVGPWTLRRVLGRGGMGAVYLAERHPADFHQRAALKLIKLGMDSREIVERFLAERRILARLDHPNIARLIDGGVDLRGRPYFVMEWIDGLPLIDFAQAHRLDLRARVELFLKLCDAVGYAHRQLVVHRDLKPGNVLVDLRGDPKLLDFGIAKLLEVDDAEDTSATGPRFFTRAYAAPEQMRGEPVTTATDVYALGALLFELLAGTALHKARKSRVDTRVLLADARRQAGELGPENIPARALAGDLALIVTKSVRDDPLRRYSSVEAFAADLHALLDGRPVIARPDSIGYRLRRFVSRHWLGVTASSAVLVAILGGTGVALWQAHRAQQQALRADQVSAFLASVFRSATPESEMGGAVTASSLLQRGAERIGQELSDQPAVQARLYGTLADAYFYLGEYSRSAELFEQGRVRAPASDWRTQTELLRGLAKSELALGKLTLARTHIDHARGLIDAHADDEPLLFAHVRSVEKSVLGNQGDATGAREIAEEVYAKLRQLLGADAEATLEALNDLGTWTQAAGDAEAALPLFELALQERRRISGTDHPETAAAMHNLQLALLRLGRLDQASSMAEAALALRRKVLPATHRDLARSLGALAVVRARQDRMDEARRLREEGIAILRNQESPDLLLLGQELTNAAVDAFQASELKRAEDFAADAVAVLEPTVTNSDIRLLAAQTYLNLVKLHRGALTEAEAGLRDVIAREAKSQQMPAAQHLATWRYLARCLRWQGRPAAAQEVLASAPQWIAEHASALSANDRARTDLEFAGAALENADLKAASAAIESARLLLPVDANPVDLAQLALIEARLKWTQGDMAQSLLLAGEATQLLRERRGEAHPDTREAALALAAAAFANAASPAHRTSLLAAISALESVRPWHPEVARMRAWLAPL